MDITIRPKQQHPVTIPDTTHWIQMAGDRNAAPVFADELAQGADDLCVDDDGEVKRIADKFEDDEDDFEEEFDDDEEFEDDEDGDDFDEDDEDDFDDEDDLDEDDFDEDDEEDDFDDDEDDFDDEDEDEEDDFV